MFLNFYFFVLYHIYFDQFQQNIFFLYKIISLIFHYGLLFFISFCLTLNRWVSRIILQISSRTIHIQYTDYARLIDKVWGRECWATIYLGTYKKLLHFVITDRAWNSLLTDSGFNISFPTRVWCVFEQSAQSNMCPPEQRWYCKKYIHSGNLICIKILCGPCL